MKRLRMLLTRIVGAFAPPRRDDELDEEVRAHLELLAEEHQRRGLSREDARRAALRDFGGVARTLEAYREQRGLPFFDRLQQDLRYAIRMWRRAPGFSLVVVLVLGLGIGANSAIFSIVDALFLRTLPVSDPGRLAYLSVESPRGSDDAFSFPDYLAYRDQNHVFTALFASGGAMPARMTVSGEGATEVEAVKAERVSGQFFSVLGVEPAVGRLLNDEDDRADRPSAVVAISYALWKRRFGLDPQVVGRRLTLNDTPMTIVGVTPPGFSGFEIGTIPDLWHPLEMVPAVAQIDRARLRDPGWTWLRLMGRLKPETSPSQARAEINVLFQRQNQEQIGRLETRGVLTARERRTMLERRVEVNSGAAGWSRFREPLAAPLVVVMIAVGIVLVIACANVANLMLARAAARQKETAVRLALGAGRRRIVQQHLTESLLLAVAGGMVGVVIAQWGAQLLLAALPRTPFELEFGVHMSMRLLIFTAAVSAFTVVLFGLVPALRSTRFDVATRMKSESAGATAHRSTLVLNRILVVAQVALSLLLLVGAGLFVRTLQNLEGMDTGFDRERVITFRIDSGGYTTERRNDLYRRVLDRLATLPGIRTATLSSYGLLSDDSWGQRIAIPGYVAARDENMRVNGQVVGPRFFETIGTPLVSGRDFTDEDAQPRDRRHRVAIVNETMAQRYFADRNAIGLRFDTPAGDSMEIVGVVRDIKYTTLRQAAPPTFYVPIFQTAVPGTTFVVRTAAEAPSVADTLRRAVRDVDPAVLVHAVLPLDEIVNASVTRERFVAQLASVFGLFALMLASTGLYALISYSVTRRRADIAIRMALGAARARVIWMVLREDLALLAVGFIVGLPAAIAASKLIESLLFGVTATDPTTIVIASAVMIGVGVAAGYLPAQRASRVDPLIALRCE